MRCMCGVYVVYVWCMSGVCVVYVWCMCGVCVVYVFPLIFTCTIPFRLNDHLLSLSLKLAFVVPFA